LLIYYTCYLRLVAETREKVIEMPKIKSKNKTMKTLTGITIGFRGFRGKVIAVISVSYISKIKH
jgi:hypothetical protein